MKRPWSIATLVSITLASSTAALAQTPANPVTVSLFGGVAVPMGNLDDVAKVGFNFGGAVDLGPASLPFRLRVDLAYTKLGTKKESISEPFDFSAKSDVNTMSGTLNAVFTTGVPGAAMRPYFLAGAGYYNTNFDGEIRSELGDFDFDETKGSLGFNGGMGVRFQFVGFSSFVEARYHHIMKAVLMVDEDDSEFTQSWESGGYFPIVFGITIGG
jgi:hypothetical protein